MKRDLARSRATSPACLAAAALALLLSLSASPSSAALNAYASPLRFAWAPSSGVVAHYNVYLSEDGRAFQRVAQVTTPSCQVPVQDGRTYVLRVQAENAQGTGPLSDPSEQILVLLSGPPGDPGDPPPPESPPPAQPSNNRPVADAGPDQVLDPTRVTLDGSRSHDPDGDPLSFRWTQTAGPAVVLSDVRARSPWFLGITAGLYRFRLVVNDGKVDSLQDVVNVTIRNVAPTANAGPDQVVNAGGVVTLDGGGSSDPNNDPLTYRWTQTGGPAVVLRADRTRSCWFVPETSGVYRFALVVSDGRLDSNPDEVQVVVHAVNHVPTADAGPDQTVTVGTRVTLDGSGSSDPDGDPLTYRWTKREGPGIVFLRGERTAHPSFTPRRVGVYRFRLVVSDGTDASAPDEVTVTVEGRNRAPVGKVKKEFVTASVGDWVELNGAESFDPDGDSLTYAWYQVQGPRVSLEGTHMAVAGFYAISPGALQFHLVVDDGELYSHPVVVDVHVDDSNNRLPIAHAGDDLASSVGVRVCLDGSGSWVPDPRGLVTFSWSQAGGPHVALLGRDTATPCFTPASPAEYVFGLTVTQGGVQSASDLVVVYVDVDMPAMPPVDSSGQRGSSGCSVSPRAGTLQGNPGPAEWFFVICLFLPALAVSGVLRWRLRRPVSDGR